MLGEDWPHIAPVWSKLNLDVDFLRPERADF